MFSLVYSIGNGWTGIRFPGSLPDGKLIIRCSNDENTTDPDLLSEFARVVMGESDPLLFGAGRRHCSGSLLALMEMEVVINRPMDRVRWSEWVNGPPP